MCRAFGFLAVVTLVVTGAACTGSGRDHLREADADAFCGAFADYLGIRQAIQESRVGDPRRLEGPLAAVEPPAALSGAWPAFAEWERANIAAYTVDASHERRWPRFWVEPVPESQEVSEVESFWDRECFTARGYEVTTVISETDPRLPPYDEPPDGRGVRVVDVGFTQGSWWREPGLHAYSYGVMVENTGDHVALDTKVEVRIAGNRQEHVIPVLLPGQRFGIGDEADLDQKWTEEPDVAIDAGYWWPAAHDVIEYAAMTTRDIITLEREFGSLELRFTISSDYPVTVGNVASRFPYETYAVPYVVFRDADGDIIGGASGEVSTSVPPGLSFGRTSANVSGVLRPDDIDHARTSVYF